MNRKSVVLLTISIGLGLAVLGATVGRAQLTSLLGPERVALIFDGDLQTDSGGIKITSWGSGTAEPSYDQSYVGPQVLKVTSQGLYQGIVLHLANPVNLQDFLSSPDGFVDLRILPAQVPKPKETPEEARARQGQRGGGRGGGGGGMRGGGGGGRGGGGGMRGGGGGGRGGGGGGRGGGGGMRGGGGRGGRASSGAPSIASAPVYELQLTGGMRGGGGRGGGGMRGGGGGGRGGGGMRGGGMRGGQAGGRQGGRQGGQAAGRPTGPQEKALTIQNMRIVLFTDQGQLIAYPVPVFATTKDKRGWVPVSAALARFSGPKGARELRAIGLFGDQTDKFYLGQARLIIDHTPVKVTVKIKPGVAHTDELVDFTSELSGGPLDEPQVSWSFGEGELGKDQAIGSHVKYIYKKPGDYIATATVKDKAGVRSPASGSAGVRVEQAPKPGTATGTGTEMETGAESGTE